VADRVRRNEEKEKGKKEDVGERVLGCKDPTSLKSATTTDTAGEKRRKGKRRKREGRRLFAHDESPCLISQSGGVHCHKGSQAGTGGEREGEKRRGEESVAELVFLSFLTERSRVEGLG